MSAAANSLTKVGQRFISQEAHMAEPTHYYVDFLLTRERLSPGAFRQLDKDISPNTLGHTISPDTSVLDADVLKSVLIWRSRDTG